MIPASGQLAMSTIAAEFGVSAGVGVASFNLGHPFCRALANIASGPISYGNLRGRSGSITATADFVIGPGGQITYPFSNSVFFNNGGGPLYGLWTAETGGQEVLQSALYFSGTPPTWQGNIILTNETTGVSNVLYPDLQAGPALQWLSATGQTFPFGNFNATYFIRPTL